MHPDTTIVIAAYNEEHRLPDSLRKIEAYRRSSGLEAEIVVVDDGSTDGTAAIVRLMSEEMSRLRLISYGRNMGKGYALRTGVLASAGRHVLVTDADLSTPIEELDTLKSHISSQGHDIAIGSRGLGNSDVVQAQPPWRRGMGQIFSKLVRLLVLDDFKDTQCGFKLFSGEVARNLFKDARVDRFAYDVEILALAKKKGYRVAEVPITWKNSTASRVSPLVDSLQMVADLVRIRLRMQEEQEEELVPLEKPIPDMIPRKRGRKAVAKRLAD